METMTRQPSHIDLTTLNFGGSHYYAYPVISEEACSWCDSAVEVLLVRNGNGDQEYACAKHADQYFFGAKAAI